MIRVIKIIKIIKVIKVKKLTPSNGKVQQKTGIHAKHAPGFSESLHVDSESDQTCDI